MITKRQPKPSFEKLYDSLDLSLPYRTPLTKASLQLIYQYGLMANKVAGHAAEAGVYSGASLFLLANVFGGIIHAFDSWEGLPELSVQDQVFVRQGGFSYDLEKVQERLSFTDRIVYHKGFFCDTFDKVSRDIRFSYVFCDVDLYTSVNECFRFFYPRMSRGGIMFFDDYYCSHTPGVKIAVNEMIVVYGISNAYRELGFVVIEV